MSIHLVRVILQNKSSTNYVMHSSRYRPVTRGSRIDFPRRKYLRGKINSHVRRSLNLLFVEELSRATNIKYKVCNIFRSVHLSEKAPQVDSAEEKTLELIQKCASLGFSLSRKLQGSINISFFSSIRSTLCEKWVVREQTWKNAHNLQEH